MTPESAKEEDATTQCHFVEEKEEGKKGLSIDSPEGDGFHVVDCV